MASLKDKIIATAYIQFRDGGFEAITLRSIAKELNVTHPAVYTYFDSKDQLLGTLKLQILQELKEHLFTGINPHGTFKQIMGHISINFFEFFQANRTKFSIFLQLENNKECAETQLQILEYIDQLLLLPETNMNIPQIMWYALIGNMYAWYCAEITKERALILINEAVERLSKSQ